MRELARILLVLLGAMSVGCDATMTDKPHGTPWTDDEMAVVDGWWTTQDGDLFRVKRVDDGKAVLAALDWESPDEGFVASNWKLVFTHCGDHDLVFMRGRGFFADYPGYCFARVVSYDDVTIEIADSIDESFLTILATKQIEGDAREDKHSGKWAYITASSDDFLRILDNRGIDLFFNSSETSTYKKVVVGAKK